LPRRAILGFFGLIIAKKIINVGIVFVVVVVVGEHELELRT